MSYHIYTTKGLILSQKPWRESDRVYNILTRDLGLVRARALGVRKESSKLRGSIEPVSLASVSLVRGKEYWRLTSAEFLQKTVLIGAIMRPLALVEKLVQGEAPHPELFGSIEEYVLSLDLHSDSYEVNLVSRILFHLGYLKESDLVLNKKSLIQAINEGIQSSHL